MRTHENERSLNLISDLNHSSIDNMPKQELLNQNKDTLENQYSKNK